MKSDVAVIKKLQNALKTDQTIKEICYKMIQANNNKRSDLLPKFNQLYTERQQEIIQSYIKYYNTKDKIMLYVEDIKLK